MSNTQNITLKTREWNLCWRCYAIWKKRNTLFEKLLSHLRIHFNRITWVEDWNFLPATCRGWDGWASPKHQPRLTHPAISQTCFLTQKQFVENWFEFGDFHLYYTPKLNVHLCSAGFLHFDYFRLIHTGLPAPGFVPKWLLTPPHPLSFLIPVCVLTVFFCLILVFLDWKPLFLKSKKQKVQFYCQLFFAEFRPFREIISSLCTLSRLGILSFVLWWIRHSKSQFITF